MRAPLNIIYDEVTSRFSHYCFRPTLKTFDLAFAQETVRGSQGVETVWPT